MAGHSAHFWAHYWALLGAPDLFGGLHHEAQLSDLLIPGQRIAVQGGGEAALRGQAQLVDGPDVGLVLVLGVLAAAGDLGALLRVVEVRQAGVVELEVGAAEAGQPPDLVRVGGAEVFPEHVDVGVHGLVDRRGPAAVVDQAGRGDGQLPGRRRGRRGGGVAEELERGAEDGVIHPELARDLDRGRGELDVAGLVVEHAAQVLFGLLHTGDLVYEVHMPGGPPELAVGDRAQPDVCLHRDRVADRGVLDGPQVIGGDRAAGGVLARLQQGAGAEQAADVIGAEGRCRACGHGILSAMYGVIRTAPVRPGRAPGLRWRSRPATSTGSGRTTRASQPRWSPGRRRGSRAAWPGPGPRRRWPGGSLPWRRWGRSPRARGGTSSWPGSRGPACSRRRARGTRRRSRRCPGLRAAR